ncbi:helix-turn-helix domain-containing protein [Streptomyces mirabilis]
MRRLKERSGLTYRELEVKAARNGDMLARSTLADVLGRTNLPRPDVLAAFVRACGVSGSGCGRTRGSGSPRGRSSRRRWRPNQAPAPRS